MHELGIVFYIIKEVKAVAEENRVGRVAKVVMNIGEVSTVVPAPPGPKAILEGFSLDAS